MVCPECRGPVGNQVIAGRRELAPLLGTAQRCWLFDKHCRIGSSLTGTSRGDCRTGDTGQGAPQTGEERRKQWRGEGVGGGHAHARASLAAVKIILNI